MTDLDAVHAELAGAKAELRTALLLAAGFTEACAAEGDPTVAVIHARVESAFSRLTAANLLGVTALADGRPRALDW